MPVATVLTACGIETFDYCIVLVLLFTDMLQQYLPLAVLKLLKEDLEEYLERKVATVLTACGIETVPFPIIISTSPSLQQYLPLAVLKPIKDVKTKALKIVATVLTACGIETMALFKLSEEKLQESCNSTYRLRY